MTILDECHVAIDDFSRNRFRRSRIFGQVAKLDDVGGADGVGSQPLSHFIEPLFLADDPASRPVLLVGALRDDQSRC